MITNGLKEDVEVAPLPILHFTVDIWASKVSGDKYLGMHVFWADSNFSLRHAEIGIKHYRPDPDLVDVPKASESFYKIFRATIEVFGVTMEDFASCTTESGLPTEVAKITRLALRDALASRHCGRVWDPNSPDPSFFRDVSIALLPSFDIQPIPKLRTGLDESALPQTTDYEVRERSEYLWKEIRARTLAAARTLEKRDGAARSPKRLKSVRGSEVPRVGTSCKGEEADDELAALLGDGVDGDARVDQIERSVNEELERFQEPLKKDSPLNTLAQFWRDRGRKHFTHMSYVAQQVSGYQAPTAQIERGFSAAGSCRRSRMDTNWAEMQLFLNANFERIPHEIPSVSSKSIRKHLPKNFTARDDVDAVAEHFLDPINVANDSDDGLSEAEDTDPST